MNRNLRAVAPMAITRNTGRTACRISMLPFSSRTTGDPQKAGPPVRIHPDVSLQDTTLSRRYPAAGPCIFAGIPMIPSDSLIGNRSSAFRVVLISRMRT